MTLLPADPRRIAVFRALALGDLLCATPAFRALRRRFPAAEITLIALPWAEELARRLETLDRFLPFPGWPGIREAAADPARIEAFLSAARATGYDLAIQLHGSGSVSNGFVAALGAATTIGYRDGGDDRLTHTLPWREDEHETVRWLRLVALLGADPTPAPPAFPLLPPDEAGAAELLRGLPPGDGPVVALHAGGSDAAKRWPPACFAALGRLLREEFAARLVLTGAAAEAPLTTEIRSALGPAALDLAGRTDLGALAATLRRVDLLVTNDTGASHLAAATGTPSVVLFGPTRPDRWAPLDRDRHAIVDAGAVVPEATGDGAAALAALPVGTVYRACVGQLHRFPPSPPATSIEPASFEPGAAARDQESA